MAPEFSHFLANLSFYALAGLMLLSAVGVVFHKSIVYSAVLLLVCFLSIAGIFVTLNAPFIAAAQILVYAVGLTIVLVFGVMLTGDVAPESMPNAPVVSPFEKVFGYAAAALMLVAILASTLGSMIFPTLMKGITPLFRVLPLTRENVMSFPGAESIVKDGGIMKIAEALFSQYSVAFELASILLLMAMVGAIIISKKNLPEEEIHLAGEEEIIYTSESPREIEDEKVLAGAAH